MAFVALKPVLQAFLAAAAAASSCFVPFCCDAVEPGALDILTQIVPSSKTAVQENVDGQRQEPKGLRRLDKYLKYVPTRTRITTAMH